MMDKKYLEIVAACEGDLAQHGDNFLGVGWTKKSELADARYQTMLEVIKSDASVPVSLLDFGCGTARLYEYLLALGWQQIAYSGLDLSEKFLAYARRKFPATTFYQADILSDPVELPQFDYVVLNGMFNYKGEMSFAEMWAYFQRMIHRVFPLARRGIAFNVMSKQVEWERDDLFHLPFDTLATFLAGEISRDFVIRHDYRLYEYTTYVYRREVTG